MFSGKTTNSIHLLLLGSNHSCALLDVNYRVKYQSTHPHKIGTQPIIESCQNSKCEFVQLLEYNQLFNQ